MLERSKFIRYVLVSTISRPFPITCPRQITELHNNQTRTSSFEGGWNNSRLINHISTRSRCPLYAAIIREINQSRHQSGHRSRTRRKERRGQNATLRIMRNKARKRLILLFPLLGLRQHLLEQKALVYWCRLTSYHYPQHVRLALLLPIKWSLTASTQRAMKS